MTTSSVRGSDERFIGKRERTNVPSTTKIGTKSERSKNEGKENRPACILGRLTMSSRVSDSNKDYKSATRNLGKKQDVLVQGHKSSEKRS